MTHRIRTQILGAIALALAALLGACGDDDGPATTDGGRRDMDRPPNDDGGLPVDSGMPADARIADSGLPPDAGPRPDASVPPGVGWVELPDTRMSDVCPDVPEVHAVAGCGAVASAWGGGAADSLNDRLLVWGGGHNDYWGNEVYALDLRSLVVARLTDPSPATATPDDCGVTTLADGRPNSRHTYDNLAFITHAGRMFAWGGATACRPGGGTNDTWTLDTTLLEWQRMDPTTGGPPAAFIASTDYDPETRLVYLHDTHGLWTYDYDSNTYSNVVPEAGSDYHLVGRVDVGARRFVMLGGGQAWSFDLTAGYTRTALTLAGCESVAGAAYPGLAYDPVEEQLIAWSGGDTVYVIDPVADSCVANTFPDGPGPQQDNGTNGRFRYFESIDAFALVNSMDENAWVLRLRAAE